MIWFEFPSFSLWSALALSFSPEHGQLCCTPTQDCSALLAAIWQKPHKQPLMQILSAFYTTIWCSHTAKRCTVSFFQALEKKKRGIHFTNTNTTESRPATPRTSVLVRAIYLLKYSTALWGMFHTTRWRTCCSIASVVGAFHAHRRRWNLPLLTVRCHIQSQICINLFFWLTQRKSCCLSPQARDSH